MLQSMGLQRDMIEQQQQSLQTAGKLMQFLRMFKTILLTLPTFQFLPLEFILIFSPTMLAFCCCSVVQSCLTLWNLQTLPALQLRKIKRPLAELCLHVVKYKIFDFSISYHFFESFSIFLPNHFNQLCARNEVIKAYMISVLMDQQHEKSIGKKI